MRGAVLQAKGRQTDAPKSKPFLQSVNASRHARLQLQGAEKRKVVLKWALIFALVAVIAGLFGFSSVAAGAAGVAKLLFVVCLVGFIVLIALIALGGDAHKR